MKKGFIFLSIIIVIIITISALYFIRTDRVAVDSMYKAIPIDAAFIVDVSDYHSFRDGLESNKPLLSDFLSIPFLKDIHYDIDLIDSLTKTNDAVKRIFEQLHSLMISGHPFRKDEIQCIYYFRVNTSKDFDYIDQTIKSAHGIIIGSSRSYEHASIQDIVLLGTKNEGFSYAYVDGMLMLSRSSILLEDAIRQIGIKENILNHNGLGEIVKTAGKTSVVNVFVNFEQIPRLTSRLIHSKYKEEVGAVKNFGSWAELDLNIKPDMVIFNGFSSPNENKPGFEMLVKNQKPIKFECFNKIPVSSSTFVLLGVSNFDQYIKDYQIFTESKDSKNALQDLKTNYNIDVLSNFHTLFDHEAGVIYLGNGNDTVVNNAYAIIRVKSKEEVESVLSNYIANYVEKNNLTASDFIFKQNKEKGNDQKIYSLPFGNIPSLLFGKLFTASDNNFCAVTDNYLIFGNTLTAVSNYLNQLSSGLLLSNDIEFNNFSEYFSSQSNFFFYHKPSNSLNFYGNFLKSELVSEITSNLPKFNAIQAFVYQFNIGDNGLIYNNIFVKFNAKTLKESPKTTWETQLDENIIGKPIFLKNNRDKEAEIFVQDRKNQIYLVSGKGIILWKVMLPEPIMSDIYQIDYYRNGKQQILFNTRSKIYLIDRKGKDVEKFPVALKSPATNGMAVFDYEKKRDYRIFLATENRSIIGLDKDAEQLEGWECDPTDTKVTQAIQFFRIENKDFLVCNDQNRIYIVDRKGNAVLKSKNKFPIAASNKVSLINSRSLKDAKFVLTDTTGHVIFTSLDGSTKELDCGIFPSNHWFDMYDVDNDGTKDLLFTWNRSVKAFSQKGKELFTIGAEQQILFRPVFYEFKTNIYNFSIVTNNQHIYLYKNNGELFKGFPLKGNTPFSIGILNNSENKFNLIVGSDNNFLYEYSVQMAN